MAKISYIFVHIRYIPLSSMWAKVYSRLLTSIIVLTMASSSYSQFYNGSYQDFGKSRVQHREFIWTFYKFENVDVYFYTGGKDLAIFTANSADQIIDQTEDFFDYDLEGKLELIVYNKLADLKQSNIGFTSEEEYNVGGVTRVVGSKIFLYFNGDHNHLIQQIREGIAEVLISQMMYGGNWKDRVKNSALLSLPDWYLEGLISYYSMGWNQEIENRVRDGIISGRYKRFNHLRGIDAKYAGHSIWNFIVERYGESLIPSILYMTKVSRNIESGLIFVLGSSLRDLTDDWLEFYHNKFYGYENIAGLPLDNSILKRTKRHRVYSQLKISPDGKFVAFATNQLGKYKVFIVDTETGKLKKVFKGGYKLDRLVDYSYPLIDWHPTKPLLSIITEKKEEIHLNYYFVEKDETQRRTLHHFQKVLDFSYSDDGKKFAMSAIKEGQTDIYVYHLSKNTSVNLTNDVYDDLNPRFINKSEDIVFTSNRISDTLGPVDSEIESTSLSFAKNYDVFMCSYTGKSKTLKRITNTPEYNEMLPVEFDENIVSYLSDKNGINNRMLTRFDSVISHVDTVAHYRFVTEQFPASNYKRSILEQDANTEAKKFVELIYNKGKYVLLMDDLSVEDLLNSGSGLQEEPEQDISIDKEGKTKVEDSGNEDIDEEIIDGPKIREDGKIDISDYV
ncbi:MAG: PD40 domain-containing protein, partial [Flavobacteriales bacterium]|nr:PD40 domain-containing protein [Flavobacteriales bacterium]